MLRRAGKYTGVFRITLMNNLAYIQDVALNSIFMLVVIFVFVALWKTTYSVTGEQSLGGFTLQQTIWYLVMTETITMSSPRITTRIDAEVKGGDLAYSLNRPYSYVGFQYASFMGEAAVRFFINLAVGGLVAGLSVGFPAGGALEAAQATASRVTGATGAVGVAGVAGTAHLLAVVSASALTILMAMALYFTSMMALGLLAFWVEDATALFLVYERSMWILGGLLLPLSLFPAAIRRVAEVLPFRFIINGPAQLAVKYAAGDFWRVLAGQATWLAVTVVVLALVYRAGVKRVNINGG